MLCREVPRVFPSSGALDTANMNTNAIQRQQCIFAHRGITIVVGVLCAGGVVRGVDLPPYSAQY